MVHYGLSPLKYSCLVLSPVEINKICFSLCYNFVFSYIASLTLSGRVSSHHCTSSIRLTSPAYVCTPRGAYGFSLIYHIS
jgi:hypothetical protein